LHFTIIVPVVAVTTVAVIPAIAVVTPVVTIITPIATIIFILVGDAILVDVNSPVTSFIAVIYTVSVTIYIAGTFDLSVAVVSPLILSLYLTLAIPPTTSLPVLRLSSRQPSNC
jgi:hypothetical protein